MATVKPLSTIGANHLGAAVGWLQSAENQWKGHVSNLSQALDEVPHRLPGDGSTLADVTARLEKLVSHIGTMREELQRVQRDLVAPRDLPKAATEEPAETAEATGEAA